MKVVFLAIMALSSTLSPAFANDALCPKCQKIREYNAAHPENNITWYEDFQKDHPESKPIPAEPKEKLLLAKCNCGGKEDRPRGPAGT